MLSRLSTSLRGPALGLGLLAVVLAGVSPPPATATERVRPASAPASPETAPGSGQHAFRYLTTDAAFRAGTNEGTAVAGGSVTISRPAGTMGHAGTRWSWSRWTSWWVAPGQSFTQLIPTWNALTPVGTWVQVQARVRSSAGRVSGWKVMGSWTTRDSGFRRTTGGTQRDAVAGVSTDTLSASPGVTLTGYQLRAVLLRSRTSTATPSLRTFQAVASRPATSVTTSLPALPARTLDVPRYSQMTHRGEYPQYGGGGQAWCSPTSLSMILGYYRALPSSSNYSWVRGSYPDRWVDHVARVVYDYGYGGAGNWAFNTAYAANLTGEAFVTRLSSLREAERFIAAGIPLAASISFSRGQLRGSPISATNGHLVVITGFTSGGDVVVNDPAAPSNASVRRVYDRGQFERVWLGRSSGTVYVVRDAAHPLPARSGNRNW